MHQLSIQQNEVKYAALFVRPALDLWGDGRRIVSGLYEAFREYGIGLGDLSSNSKGDSLADVDVVVNLASRGRFTFRFDRIEAHLSNFKRDQLDQYAVMIDTGTLSLWNPGTNDD